MNATNSSSLLLPSGILTIFHEIQIYNYIQVSSIAVLAFDYLLTFSDEVEFVWNGKLNPVPFLFYINRYLPFFDGALHITNQFLFDPSVSTCHTLFHMYGWLTVFGYLIANSIVVLRTYAIWENRRDVGFSLFTLLFLCIVGMCYCTERFLLSFLFIPSPSRSAFPGCFIAYSGRILWIAYLPILGFHTVILILTVIKVIQERRAKSCSLFRTIYRDVLMIYLYLLGSSLANIIIFHLTRRYMTFSLVSFHRTLHAIFTGRLVMNIRRAISEEEHKR